MTDEGAQYTQLGKEFADTARLTTRARNTPTMTAQLGSLSPPTPSRGITSIFKRGMIGIYQHCGEQHLHRYLAEFDFRYSYRIKIGYDDTARADRALQGVKGKRFTYETTKRN